LNKGARIDVRDVNGESPLHKAAASGNVELIRLLLAHGADCTVGEELDLGPDSTNAASSTAQETGRTPVVIAALHGKINAMELLSSAMLDAVKAKTMQEQPNSLIIEPRRRISWNQQDLRCMQKLIEEGNLAAVKLLLEVGFNAGMIDEDTLNTPMLWACAAGNVDAITLLLSQGAPLMHLNVRG
jgi:ankyrin repeat protein